MITGVKTEEKGLADLSIPHLIELGWDITYPLLIGGLITGVLFSIPAYFITKRFVILYRERRQKRSGKIELPSPTA